jgi:hypothetical protein
VDGRARSCRRAAGLNGAARPGQVPGLRDARGRSSTSRSACPTRRRRGALGHHGGR